MDNFGYARLYIGRFRTRKPYMFEGEWRALKMLKILKQDEDIVKIIYHEEIIYSCELLEDLASGQIIIYWYKKHPLYKEEK